MAQTGATPPPSEAAAADAQRRVDVDSRIDRLEAALGAAQERQDAYRAVVDTCLARLGADNRTLMSGVITSLAEYSTIHSAQICVVETWLMGANDRFKPYPSRAKRV